MKRAERNADASRAEFEMLEAFFSVLWPQVFAASLTADADPSVMLARMVAASPSAALRGLRQAVCDLIEATQDLCGAELGRIERSLRESGAPSLATMRSRRSSKIFAILRRQKIRDETEYRLVAAELSDVSSALLQRPMRELASRLLGEHDARKR